MLGDVHGRLDEQDVHWLDGQGFDAILFVGDLGHMRWRTALPVAETMSKLRTATYWMPGNHDGMTFPKWRRRR